MGKQAIVTAQSPNYNGMTYGIRFNAGQAVVQDKPKPGRWDWTFTQLVQNFQNTPGYEVTVVDETPREPALAAAQPERAADMKRR